MRDMSCRSYLRYGKYLSHGIDGEDELFDAMFDQNIINPYIVSYDKPHQNLNSTAKYKFIW